MNRKADYILSVDVKIILMGEIISALKEAGTIRIPRLLRTCNQET